MKKRGLDRKKIRYKQEEKQSEARFEGHLDTRHLDEPVDGKWFKVISKDFAFIDKDGVRYDIVPNTYTDFASIPWYMRWMISRTGRHGKPSVLHDCLCCCDTHKVSRKKADQLFQEALEVVGDWKLKRKTMYGGLRTYAFITRKK